MWKQKVSASIANSYPVPTPELIKRMKEIGFEAVAPEWNNHESFIKIMEAVAECGIEVCSVHAPFTAGPSLMWNKDKETVKQAKQSMLEFLKDCIAFKIPVAVVHSWEENDNTIPTEEGFAPYDEIVEFATKNGVCIAFENIERPDVYLEALLNRYKDNDKVGFCWDSGHEMAFTPEQDLLKKYGHRLMMTHLSDNLGIRNYEGITSHTDDLHLMPGDGIADWDNQIKRLKDARHQDVLNLEIARNPHKTRHENFWHSKITMEQYYTKVYMCACKLAAKYIK